MIKEIVSSGFGVVDVVGSGLWKAEPAELIKECVNSGFGMVDVVGSVYCMRYFHSVEFFNWQIHILVLLVAFDVVVVYGEDNKE